MVKKKTGWKKGIINVLISFFIIVLLSYLITGDWRAFSYGLWIFIGINFLIAGILIARRWKQYCELTGYGAKLLRSVVKNETKRKGRSGKVKMVKKQ